MRLWAAHIALLAVLLAPPAHAQLDRDWKVFVVPFSHIDVGYTAPVPEVLAQHHAYLDSVLVYLDRTDGEAPSDRFRWTIEVPWALPSWIASRPAEAVEALAQRVRAGRVEIGALHANLQTDLMGSEELVRALYLAQSLRDDLDVPIRTAVLNDTPGATWALAQLLPKSGVPYLALAPNSAGADFYETTDLPHLFYWEAQSGERVLVWRSLIPVWAYLEGHVWGFYAASFGQMESGLTGLLEDLQAAGYPYDAVLVNAATGDNGAPDLRIVENVRQWNAQRDDAEVRIATFSDFFDHVAEAYAGAIPTVRGDAPNWWSWGLATSSTGGYLRSRAVQDLLPTAEVFAAVASAVAPGFAYPADALREAYVHNLLFEEHTFGAADANDAAANAAFWARKMGWIDDAHQTAETVIESALAAWGREIPTGADPIVAVFNPSAWARSEVVAFDLDAPGVPAAFEVVDAETGAVRPAQVLSDGRAAFRAEAVPPLGYRAYRLAPVAGPLPPAQPLAGLALETDRYRVRLDPATGGIAEAFDKALGQALARPGGRFSQYLYNGSGTPAGLQVVASDSGAVLQRLVLRGTAPGSDSYETEVALYDGLARIDLRHRYDKRPPTAFEGVDFRFDFGLPSAELRYDLPLGHVHLHDDELSGFRSNHYAAHRWFGVSAGSGGPSAVLAAAGPAIHAHNAGTFSGDLRLIASFNTSGTGYRAGVGDLAAQYALTSDAGGVEPSRATRFAEEAGRPLRARVLPAGQTGSLPAASFSFLGIEAQPLVLTTLKRAERGGGFVARLYNPSPEPVAARLALGVPVLGAAATTPLEADGVGIGTDGDGVPLALGPHEVLTLRLDLAVPTSTEETAASAGLRLEPAYPNPFASATTLAFHLDRPARVRLVVYDVLGRRVAVLAEGERPAGRHEAVLDAARLSAGVYLAALEATAGGETARQTRPVVLVR